MLKTTGYILFILSCLAFLMILVVPWLGLTKSLLAGITTGLIIAGEVLFYTSLFILGKSFWNKIKGRLIFWKKSTSETVPTEQKGHEQ